MIGKERPFLELFFNCSEISTKQMSLLAALWVHYPDIYISDGRISSFPPLRVVSFSCLDQSILIIIEHTIISVHVAVVTILVLGV